MFVLRCNRLHRSLAVLTQCSQTGTAWLHRHAHDTRTHTADTLHTDRPHTHVHTHTHDTDTRTVTHKHKHTHTYARHLHTGTQTHAYAVFILLTPAAVASEPARRLLSSCCGAAATKLPASHRYPRTHRPHTGAWMQRAAMPVRPSSGMPGPALYSTYTGVAGYRPATGEQVQVGHSRRGVAEV